MRSKRTRHLVIAGALLALGVLLMPITPASASVHHHGSGTDALAPSPISPLSTMTPAAPTASAPPLLESATMAPVSIPSPPFPMTISPITIVPGLPARPTTATARPRSSNSPEQRWSPPTLTPMAARAMGMATSEMRLLEGDLAAP
jgi:hypothetical protein